MGRKLYRSRLGIYDTDYLEQYYVLTPIIIYIQPGVYLTRMAAHRVQNMERQHVAKFRNRYQFTKRKRMH